jgi:hypothetical protein
MTKDLKKRIKKVLITLKPQETVTTASNNI